MNESGNQALKTIDFEPPRDHEDVIDSADEKERVQWLVKKYLRWPPVSIRAPYGNFDSLKCDPHGWVWGIVISNEPTRPGAKVIRCKEYLIGSDNVVIEQPLQLSRNS